MDAEAIALSDQATVPKLPIILLSGYVDLQERVFWFVDEQMNTDEERTIGKADTGH